MKMIYKIIINFFLITLLVLTKSVYAVQIDLTAGVIGTAVDTEYDGVFEQLYNDITTNPYETFTIGRVVSGNFISERRSILEFNLTSISAAANIESATLIMDWASGSNDLGVIDFHGFEGSGILDITNATNTGNIVATRIATNYHEVSVDVTDYIQGYLDNNISWAGFLGIETVDGVNANFWSNYNDSYEQICGPYSPPSCVNGEIIHISSHPTLSVVYATPLPSAVLLFTSGLLGLIGFSRSQRAR
ncbi:MAG: hypothetical protein OEY66_09820 [Gammaproteobacteria bacterium]|nr:hypothetical protein [Gammaproteobacteria bacterium]